MADQSTEESVLLSQVEEPPNLTLSDDELDIHVCGKCKASFTDLTAYIEHKKSKVCSKSRAENPVNQQLSPEIEGENGSIKKTVIPAMQLLSPRNISPGNKVVVELLDPVDVNSVITDTNVIVHTDTDMESQFDLASTEKPKKRHKRKNSTPKTTRKTVASKTKLVDTPGNVDAANNTVTVHIPESQLVHLGGEAASASDLTASKIRKQEATSVFVPIYLTSNTKKTFKCNKCPAEFRSKEERGDHGSLHQKQFKCNDCNKKYYTIEALESHKANETHVHTCDKCSKVFHSQVYLRRHLSVHVEERNFECDICHKSYTSMANCRAHKRSVHAVIKKHVCDECGKAFARKDKLKRHQLIHIPYPNRPIFPCPFRSHTGCTSTFYREDKLKRHLFTHSKEKPYKCEQCEKGFARRDNLNDHMKTHTKDFSYVCSLCQRGFLGPAKLKKHLRAVHPDGDYDIEEMTQKARDGPTMASLKTTIQPQHETSLEQDKALETQVNVGLDVVSQAICNSHSDFTSSQQDAGLSGDEDDIHKNKETTTESHESLIHVAHSLPPAPPLIHQGNGVPSTSGQLTLPPTSVFIPRIGLQNTTPYSRDMLTIPNDLLSIVHGLN